MCGGGSLRSTAEEIGRTDSRLGRERKTWKIDKETCDYLYTSTVIVSKTRRKVHDRKRKIEEIVKNRN
jgi:hypothetical protein